MKIKNVRISVRGLREMGRDFAETMERVKRGEHVAPRRELSFETVDTLRKVITKRRLELLHMIAKKQPESVYELAHLVDRDLKSVNTDLKELVRLGLVDLERSEEARKKVKPIVTYDTLNIEIEVS